MLKKSAEEIVRDVRICMDEAASNESEFLSTTDQEELDVLIASKMSDAYKVIHLSASPQLLTSKIEEMTSASDNMGVVRVDVPKTVLRVLGVTINGWSRYVSEFILWTDRAYAELKNPITTGTMDNPKVAILEKDADNYTLELYSSDKDEATVVLYTIPEWGYNVSSEDETEKFEISEKVYSAIVYYIAGLVYKTYKDVHGDVMMGQALQMIEAKI